jgi:hypothetical protein
LEETDLEVPLVDDEAGVEVAVEGEADDLLASASPERVGAASRGLRP